MRFIEDAARRFPEEKTRLEKAYEFAHKAHDGQMRKDGKQFIVHPEAVAQRLLECQDDRIDADTIIAALLHDTVEDTAVTLDQIKDSFGEEVASILDALTHPVGWKTKKERDELHAKKIRQAASKDSRVVAIKLADRIHNSQDGIANSAERFQEIRTITTKAYVPLGRQYGFNELADELESIIGQTRFRPASE